MTRFPALFAVLTLLQPLHAGAAPARTKAAALLESELGLPAVEALERRGLLLTTGSSKPRRLAVVAWETLERHAAAGPRLSELVAAYDAVRKGAEPADALDAFADLRGMPAGGLLAGAARSALAGLAERASAARGLEDAGPALLAAGSLYRTAWGRALSERTHAELGGRALSNGAEQFYTASLAAPDAPAKAAEHLLKWAAVRGRADVKEQLEAAKSSGQPSPTLKQTLEDYLADQARVETLLAVREKLTRLERDSDSRRQLDDLRAAAPRLSADLAARLKDLLAEKDEAASATLTGPALHVRPAAEDPVEPGDDLVLSVAYWLDGVPAGKRSEVAELLYRDDGDKGLVLLSRALSKRASGGPYALTLKTPAPDGRADYRLYLDAPDADPARRETAQEVSSELAVLRAEAAAAEALGRACRLEESSAAWKALIEQIADSKKPARARLASAARARLKAVESWASARRELEESLDGARLYASKERCEYRTDRAERALTILKSLPAGCERIADSSVAAELSKLASETDSRRRLQEGFRAAVAKARDREAACKASEAAELYAGAMALLDSDAGARCGALEQEYAAVRMSDLPRAAAADRLSAALDGELGRSRQRLSAGDPAGALESALPLATALGRLPDARCWSGPSRAAAELTQAAGAALSAREAGTLKLPSDPLTPVLEEARRDWERRQAEKDERRSEAESVQAPNATGEAQ
ncbi:MAG: hypothetical protein HYZ75_00520 [Elusimicrobia bacterium]|nr:hypothetical protein [Elusimicrobiota bacterium]